MTREPLLDHLSEVYGKLLEALAWLACVMVFAMVMMICTDVLLRNVALIPTMRGLDWSNDITEAMRIVPDDLGFQAQLLGYRVQGIVISIAPGKDDNADFHGDNSILPRATKLLPLNACAH